MTNNAKKFLAEASKNGALKAELAKVLSGLNTDAVAKVAKAHGYDLTAEDFEGLMVEVMSADELQAVAGGGILSAPEEAHNRITGLNEDPEGFLMYCFTIAMR